MSSKVKKISKGTGDFKRKSLRKKRTLRKKRIKRKSLKLGGVLLNVDRINSHLINNEEIQPIRQQRVRRRLDFIEIDDEQPPPIPFMRAVDYDSIRINGHINNSFWELPESRRNIILEEQARLGRNIRTIQDIQYSLYIPLSVNETMFLERCSSRKLQRLWRDYQQKRNIRNQRVRDDDNLWMLELSQIEKEFLGFN